MNTTPSQPRESGWTRWYRRALPAYWIFLFACTHFPNLRLDVPIESPDKYAHLGAFGLLAFLWWRFAETIKRLLSARFVWISAFWLGAYAAFDEYLQQFVGRTTDLEDWLCNMVGILAVLAALEWRRRVTVRRARPVSGFRHGEALR